MSPVRGPRSPRLVLTVHQAARQLGVSVITVRRRVRAGEVRAVQVGGTWRVPTGDTDALASLPERCNVWQVANSLDVSVITVRRWIHSGAVPATMSGRQWWVDRSFLEELLADAEGAGPAIVGPALLAS